MVTGCGRTGFEPEQSFAIRAGVEELSLWKRVELSLMGEGVFTKHQKGVSSNANLLIPLGPLGIGPTYTYKSEGIWTPIAPGFAAEHIVGIKMKLLL